MKIEANLSPEHLRWLAIALAIAAGIGHQELMLMVGI